MGAPKILSELEVVKTARKGITKKTINDIIQMTGMTQAEFARYLNVTPRAIQRKDVNEHLSTNTSEKALIISNLYSRGSQVLSSLENFKLWMETPNVALGNVPPKEYLDTFSGIEYLMDELGRIENGFML